MLGGRVLVLYVMRNARVSGNLDLMKWAISMLTIAEYLDLSQFLNSSTVSSSNSISLTYITPLEQLKGSYGVMEHDLPAMNLIFIKLLIVFLHGYVYLDYE